MTEEPIVAVYPTAADAERAVAALSDAGVPKRAVTTGEDPAMAPAAKGLWTSLFGEGPGPALVTVTPPEGTSERVIEILDRHHPLDLDDAH